MNEELKQIKKYFGEKFSHLCRDLFPTILDKYPNKILEILLEHFDIHKFLYDDLINNGLISDFKDYINNFFCEKTEEIEIDKTPEELLKEVHYDLFECKTEDDIQKFKKYYKSNEKLCTFYTDRLEKCYVFFAVKENADELKRENFVYPERQDEYGTSVISIQFTKDKTHTLSIKNRYNHTVINSDATFSNNLDNIVIGLTKSFEQTYGLAQSNNSNIFEIPGYVKANNDKYYKYNYEINNIYYCVNNIIIDNYEVKKYDKSKYLLMDYFILDLQKKNITLYDLSLCDGFITSIDKVVWVSITKNNSGKKIVLKVDNDQNYLLDDIVIELDNTNKIIGYTNNNVKKIDSYFLIYNRVLKYINITNTEFIDYCFLYRNENLEKIILPKVSVIEGNCLCNNKLINYIELPIVQKIGEFFMLANEKLEEIYLPNVEYIAGSFLGTNRILKSFSAPNVLIIEHNFMNSNRDLEYINIFKVKKIGNAFLNHNTKLQYLNLINAQEIGKNFMCYNEILKYIDISNVFKIGDSFLVKNKILEKIDISNVNELGSYFLSQNQKIDYLELPYVEYLKEGFMFCNTNLKKLYCPNLISYDLGCLQNNTNISLDSIIMENKVKNNQYVKK